VKDDVLAYIHAKGAVLLASCAGETDVPYNGNAATFANACVSWALSNGHDGIDFDLENIASGAFKASCIFVILHGKPFASVAHYRICCGRAEFFANRVLDCHRINGGAYGTGHGSLCKAHDSRSTGGDSLVAGLLSQQPLQHISHLSRLRCRLYTSEELEVRVTTFSRALVAATPTFGLFWAAQL
jgi:hypothetical protein